MLVCRSLHPQSQPHNQTSGSISTYLSICIHGHRYICIYTHTNAYIHLSLCTLHITVLRNKGLSEATGSLPRAETPSLGDPQRILALEQLLQNFGGEDKLGCLGSRLFRGLGSRSSGKLLLRLHVAVIFWRGEVDHHLRRFRMVVVVVGCGGDGL